MKKAVVICAIFIMAIPCWAGTITVDDDGPSDFNNIQSAVDDANNGDTILIADGVYSGPGNHNIRLWGKAIKVKSENGPNNCTIDCRHEGPAFYLWDGEKPDTIIDGVTITKGRGGGVFCESNPTIQNCIITGNYGDGGGGGIWSFGNPIISKCIIEKNSGSFGGGIRSSGGWITDCLIVDNRTYGNGGGINGWGSDVNITNCVISGNLARGWGGGISECGLEGSISANISNCTINFNKAGIEFIGADSGGLYDCYGVIRNCIVWGNYPVENKTNSDFIEFAYSCVEGGVYYNNNIIDDPLFVSNDSSRFWEVAPIVYWNFDEGDGSRACDSISITDGTVFNAEWAVGRVGKGLLFNGESSYVDILIKEDSADVYFDIDESFSISAWVKCNKDNSSILALGFENGLWIASGYELEIYNNRLRFSLMDNPNYDQPESVTGTTILTDNQWHFVTAIRNPQTFSLCLYVDGNSDIAPVFYSAHYMVGQNDIYIGQQFGGIIDEVAIYNRALSEDEISEFYLKGLTGHNYIPESNYGDYHLKSEAGRWDQNSRSWVKDDVTSPCIDAGDPNSDWTGELWPHGKRINMGAFGGTAEASMSLSNEGNIADLDNDDLVGAFDLLCFAEQWLVEAAPIKEDLDRNGIVDFLDFAILGNNWN